MARFFISVFLAMMLSVASLAQPTIWAYRSYQPYEQTGVTGPITFRANSPEAVTLLADQSNMGRVYAGTYFNYKWYGQVTHIGTQTSIDGLFTIDMTDGHRTFVAPSNRALSDMTHDYSTGITYGISNSAQKLATIDLKTGTVVAGGTFTDTEGAQCYMVALAADLDGTLYGVATNDNFYSINKETAVCTLIGSTGVDAAFTQTMAFDHNTRTLYWVNNAEYKLYTIDVKTGKATAVGNTDSLNAFAIPYIHAPKGAPDRVTARKIATQGSEVTIEWTNPVIDAQGEPLASLDGVKIYRDGSLLTTVAKTGATGKYTDTNVTDGLHTYKLVPYNAAGEGGADTDDLEIQVGQNPPGAVENFTVTPGNFTAELSWQAPTKGKFGGSFDPASITMYNITRVKGAARSNFSVKAPATSYTDRPGFGTYTYIIKAVNEQGEGVEVEAGPVMVKYDSWIVMTNGEFVVKKDTKYKFYDNGATGYYTNDADETLTLRPADAGSIIDAKFSQFSMDSYGDTLYVYDGINTSAPLIGSFTGESVPKQLVHLRASNEQGALTFHFVSDIMESGPGWLAEVTSVELKTNDLEAGELSGNPRPSFNAKEPYTFEVRNLSLRDVKASEYTVDIVDADGQVLTTAQGVDVKALKTAIMSIDVTPKTDGNLTIKAIIRFAADEDATNNTSNSLTLAVNPEGSKYVQISTPGSLVYIYPASFFTNESVWETIYSSERIGVSSGTLTLLTFPVKECTKNYPNIPVTIYVGETGLNSLKEHAIYASALTKVYEGNAPLLTTSKEWAFPLSTPYEYAGGNLVVMLHKVAPGTSDQGVAFGGTYGKVGDPIITREASTYSDDQHLDLESDFGWPGTALPDINMLFMSKPSGLAGIEANDVKIMVSNGKIIVAGAENQAITAYTLDGRIVATVKAATALQEIALPTPGIYIIKTATTAQKVVL